MENYSIRRARVEDIPQIRKYIDDKWGKNHWLARENGAFEWQYTSDGLDFVIGVNSQGEIKGIMGYISYADTPDRDVALSMWMADQEECFLGIQLLQYILYEVPHRVLFSPGINVATTESIYKLFHIFTGKMTQWYRLASRSKYEIALVNDTFIPDIRIKEEKTFERFLTVEELTERCHSLFEDRSVVPYKSVEYIRRRYFLHPEYKYEIYGLRGKENGKVDMLFVLRCHRYYDNSILILDDIIGNLSLLKETTSFLDALMKQKDCEYIHTYVAGIDDSIFYEAGWLKTMESNNIIPNYFSPFLRKNVDVSYCTTDENVMLLKGDGDQDRPK